MAETVVMAQGLVIDWQPILWVAGIFTVVITGLLTWIGILIRSDRESVVTRMDKHETWIMANQDEIKRISSDTKLAIERNTVAIEYLDKLVLKKKR